MRQSSTSLPLLSRSFSAWQTLLLAVLLLAEDPRALDPLWLKACQSLPGSPQLQDLLPFLLPCLCHHISRPFTSSVGLSHSLVLHGWLHFLPLLAGRPSSTSPPLCSPPPLCHSSQSSPAARINILKVFRSPIPSDVALPWLILVSSLVADGAEPSDGSLS